MVGSCTTGDLEWVEGPYVCKNECKEYYKDWYNKRGCMQDEWGGFSCSGSPRLHPFYDQRKKFSSEEKNWKMDAILLGLYRYKDNSVDTTTGDNWVLGKYLIKN